MTLSKRSVAVFDLGGVLLDWNPRHLYRKLFADEAAMEHFLATVCTTEWNQCQDAGRTFAEGLAALLPAHADKIELIEAWGKRFDEMIAGPIEAVVDILAEVKQRAAAPVYAITNWSAETFSSQLKRFDFLAWFDGIVVSGQEGVIKPDPRIFRILCDRYDLDPQSAVFIDDVAANARAASALGIHGIHFSSAKQLRRELVAVGILGA